MQIGGLGTGHSAGEHHVTGCIHDRHEQQELTGKFTMKASASARASAVQAEAGMEGQLSLAAWVRNMLGNGRGFLLNFWKGGEALSGAKGDQAATDGVPGSGAAGNAADGRAAVPAIVQEDAHTAAAVVAAQSPARQRDIRNERYYSAGEDSGKRKPEKHRWAFWRKRKEKVSFRARQDGPGEELRRHSRYRRDTLEISCVSDDDSYLMDSYDRKGEYSRLTTMK